MIPIAVVCIAVAAQLIIRLPEDLSVAPITGQTLAILMIAELMSWKKGTVAVLLYLVLGGLGLPLFADFNGGWEVLSGPSAGYFLGFLMCVALVGYWSDHSSKNLGPSMGRTFIATLFILLIGWIGLLRYLSPMEAFYKGILPFLPGALIKWFLAVVLIALARRFMGLMGRLKEN